MTSRFDVGNWRNKRGNAVVDTGDKKDLNIRHFDLIVQKDIYIRLRELYPCMSNAPPIDRSQGRWVDETEINIK